MKSSSTSSRINQEWNYVPQLPVKLSPAFDWKPKPIATLRWIAGAWTPFGSYALSIVLAVIIYATFKPPEETMREFGLGWVAQIWLRNLFLMILVAGILHLYLYTFRRQSDKLKFEKRDLDRSSKIHNFGNQVLDNMFWTLVSGVTIWSLYEIVYFWASANGYVPRLSFAGNPIWFAVMFILIPVWSSFHFYWVHRLLHWPPLYRVAHALHHRNVNIGPWSGISMHPIEHILYFSSFAIHFVVASHPLHFLFHAYFLALNPAMSHSGVEGIEVKGKSRIRLGVFYHQLHHKHFKCNYGTVEMPWDRWFGSFHDGTDEATKRIRKRKW